MPPKNSTPGSDPAARDGRNGGQAPDQAEQRRIRVQLDERGLNTTYANAFRTSCTPEEMVLDFGFNLANAPTADPNQPDVTFAIHSRVVLNYYSAKRLAMTLGQNLRRHEELFGELELDPEKRRKKPRQA